MWLDSKAVNCPQKWGNFSFSIEYSYAGDVVNKIPAGSTKRLLDQELIDTENAPTVVGIMLEVNVR